MQSRIDASFARTGAHTRVAALREAGALRLRLPRGPDCVATMVNTGGGLVTGDRVAVAVAAEPGSALTVTSVAAEKVYRAAGEADTHVATHLRVADGAALHWLPQETILFDGCRLARSLDVDIAGSGSFLGAEMLVFGRLAMGEASMAGALRDHWRVRRDGHLVFADDTALDGAIGALLDRPALGGGARAVGLVVRAGPGRAEDLDALRAGFDAIAGRVEAGASLVGEVLVARLLSPSPADLRLAMVAALARLGASTQRIWT
ncbi:MAG: urease accessory protein UreD [Caulobacteraceae bacterium]|nr:urease accessory protein UreD [Caulobacter sp.]